MMSVPELIRWSFSKKPKNLLAITEHFGETLQDLFKFLEILELIESSRNCNFLNLQYKLVEESSSWSNFLSFGSELFFANEFSRHNFSVELILKSKDCWNKEGRQIPDFSVLKDKHKFFIEVARISGDETTSEVAARIRPLIRHSSFCVGIKYSEDFSFPVIKSNERTDRQNLIDKFVNEFEKILKTLDSTTSLPKSEDILGCRVTFTKPLDGKRGYYRGCVTDAINLPEEKLYQHIASVIELKAKKRTTWDEPKKEIPYLIALDIQQDYIFQDRLISLLFGKRCHFIDSQPQYSEPSIVSDAKARGWQEFLEKVGFSQQIQSPVTDHGLLIRNEIICKNVTGIIARIGGELHYLPNPFAEEPINSLDIHALVPGKKA
ncbi:hypothetical protein MC7420_449 [Coleofasciculus chthonoplastes PCC 7420]|uniref:Uncharacterized protein n=1 Tax=Coleofasciculus chthonoplastes PCC 7420 TaxID=118168 RepID=B4VL34_9CYAN|nr:hypothetical protein [Coleofasciculus chthonoplastes]EDX77312.1 hypothetical protein MC7420_449 [Coleofasciculus chthonoplastes PCC 7420]